MLGGLGQLGNFFRGGRRKGQPDEEVISSGDRLPDAAKRIEGLSPVHYFTEARYEAIKNQLAKLNSIQVEGINYWVPRTPDAPSKISVDFTREGQKYVATFAVTKVSATDRYDLKAEIKGRKGNLIAKKEPGGMDLHQVEFSIVSFFNLAFTV